MFKTARTSPFYFFLLKFFLQHLIPFIFRFSSPIIINIYMYRVYIFSPLALVVVTHPDGYENLKPCSSYNLIPDFWAKKLPKGEEKIWRTKLPCTSTLEVNKIDFTEGKVLWQFRVNCDYWIRVWSFSNNTYTVYNKIYEIEALH